MDAELVVTGGILVTERGTERGGLAVADGRIVALGRDDDLPDARSRVDASGLLVLPGVIDTHVHARDPSVDAREDFTTATAAAAVVASRRSSRCRSRPRLSTTERPSNPGLAKINPPLRTKEAVAGLWERLARGEIDVIGSDHSPLLVEEKAPFADDMWRALPGAPGLEALLPLMLTAVADGRLSWSPLAAVTSGNAARIFGLADKGALRVGADADLVLVDADRRWTIDVDRWLTRSRGTAAIWHGRAVRDAPMATFVRGRQVADQGTLTGERGWGRLVRPTRPD